MSYPVCYRKEVRSLGLTVLVDCRRCSPVPALFKAFNILQDAMPGCIYTVLLLADRDLVLRLEKPSAVQVTHRPGSTPGGTLSRTGNTETWFYTWRNPQPYR
eukprot:XP_014032175.1 PREDICTED: puratrophin-1-like [Salmo salar]